MLQSTRIVYLIQFNLRRNTNVTGLNLNLNLPHIHLNNHYNEVTIPMNIYQALSSFSSHFVIKSLNRFFCLLLMGVTLNMVTVILVHADDADYPHEAFEIELNQEESGQLSDFGVDTNYYKFELPSDGNIIISLRIEDSSVSFTSTWQGALYHEDDLNSELRELSFGGAYKTFSTQEGLPKGTYYLKIFCPIYGILVCSTATYYLEVSFVKSDFYEKTPNEHLITATPIQLNQKYTGTLSSYEDIDYYTFSLPYDSNVTITLDHDNETLSPLEDTYWNGLLEYTNDDFIVKQLASIDLQGTPSIASIQQKLSADIYWLKIKTDKGIISSTRTPYHVTVNAIKVIHAGYAIIVQGRDKDETLKEAYNKTLDRVYQRLIKRGFLAEHILYFEQDKVNPYDAIHDEYAKPAIKNAIENWAQEQLNTSPAPFYLIMIDHGREEFFDLHPESITANELNAWLDTLESGLIDEAKKEPRFFILGTCYSGSFIDKVSKPGRVIITSAQESEVSYAGLKEADDVPEGELFIKVLFEQLEKGKTFKAAFEKATQDVENHPYAFGKQHPLLDDNGDSHGSPKLNVVDGDGERVKRLKLGIDTNFAPIDIVSMTETLYLKNTESSAILWLNTNDNDPNRIKARILIQSPNPLDITSTQQSENAQIEIDLPTKDLAFNDKNSRFEATYDAFNEPGKYTIFYHASDLSGNISPTYRSVVYKNKNSNHPPKSFSLLSPDNDATAKTSLILDWEHTTDPDGDLVTYNLIIGTDEELQTIVYQEEGLKHSLAIIDNQAQVINETTGEIQKGLKNQQTYYWRVEAVDNFGERTFSEIYSFFTNDTSAPPDSYTANVIGVLGQPVDNVTLTIIPIKNPQLAITKRTKDGSFSLEISEDSKIIVNAPGFQESIIKSIPHGTINIDIVLQPPATFSLNEQLLNIPVIFVLPEGGRFSVKLKGEMEGEQMRFRLLEEDIKVVDYPTANEATFTPEKGIVSISLVEVEQSGTTTRSRFHIELLLDSQSGKFRLTDAKALF